MIIIMIFLIKRSGFSIYCELWEKVQFYQI